jgi:hypothetical protein
MNSKDYLGFFQKLAEKPEAFTEKPSTDKTPPDKGDQVNNQEKNKSPDQKKSAPLPPEETQPGEEQVGVAQGPMEPQSPMQGAIMEVLGPEIVMAAAQGDPNAQRVLALTAAEVVKAMMGLGGGGQMGQMGQMGAPPMMGQGGPMQPMSPEMQAANNIVPPQQPAYQTPNGMYNQGMQ